MNSLLIHCLHLHFSLYIVSVPLYLHTSKQPPFSILIPFSSVFTFPYTASNPPFPPFFLLFLLHSLPHHHSLLLYPPPWFSHPPLRFLCFLTPFSLNHSYNHTPLSSLFPLSLFTPLSLHLISSSHCHSPFLLHPHSPSHTHTPFCSSIFTLPGKTKRKTYDGRGAEGEPRGEQLMSSLPFALAQALR